MAAIREVEVEQPQSTDPQGAIDRAIATLDREARGDARSAQFADTEVELDGDEPMQAPPPKKNGFFNGRSADTPAPKSEQREFKAPRPAKEFATPRRQSSRSFSDSGVPRAQAERGGVGAVTIFLIIFVALLQLSVAMYIYTSSSGLSVLNVYLIVMLYFLVPWTAVNLTDYFFIRRGRYAIPHFFLPKDNIYGVWGGRGLTAYFIGFVAMIPFFCIFNGPDEIYVGPLARAMGSVASGRTTVVIAHRLQTARTADRIIVLDRGRVVEDGTHETLLRDRGRYASLWQAA